MTVVHVVPDSVITAPLSPHVTAMPGPAQSTLFSESFADFTSRVQGGVRQIMAEQGPRRRIAVVTSAGSISAVLMGALGLNPAMMLKVCLSLMNTGVSVLRYRDDDLSVLTVNAVTHLLDPALRTFR